MEYKCKDCKHWNNANDIRLIELIGEQKVAASCDIFCKKTYSDEVCNLGANVSIFRKIKDAIHECVEYADVDAAIFIAAFALFISGYIVHGVVDWVQLLITIVKDLFI